MTPRRFLWPWLAFAIIVAGCGGTSPGARDTVHVKTVVHVVRGESREELGVAAEEARVAAAAAALERSLRRPLGLEIDAALLPTSRSEIVLLAANTLEILAQTFSEQSRRDPALFAFLQEKLRRIEARYRASAEYPDSEFDDATGALKWTMREPSRSSLFPGERSMWTALEGAYARHLATQFGKTGDKPAESDFEAYFRYLTTSRGDRPAGEREAEREEQLVSLLRFEQRVRGNPIHAEVEQYLAEHLSVVFTAKMSGQAHERLRTAYARWTSDRFFALDKKAQGRAYRALFRDDPCASDPCPQCPEIDRTALALGFFVQRPPAERADFDAFDEAVCLYEEADGKIKRNRSCANVYEFLLRTDVRAERLAATLLAADKREYLMAALANARKQMPVLLRALEKKGGHLFADALRILSSVDYYGFRDQTYVLRDELTRLWPTRPDLRPVLLRILFEDRVHTGYRDDHFAKLPDEFGPIDAALFAKFLDEGPRSVELLPDVWPALRDVVTPFEIVAPRLDGLIAARKMAASKTVSGLVRRACQSKDTEGLRVIRVVLQRRATGGDKDALALALAARDCKQPRDP